MENNKKKKLSMTSALLVVAMISLVGVGFALQYTGSAVTHIDDETSEFITVGIAKTGFTDGAIYTVNTRNDGTNVALSDLKANGSATTAYTTGHFTYADSNFTWVTGSPVANGYASAVAGTVTLTLTQTSGATADNYTMTIEGAQAPVIHQYGLSFVWTYKVGTGTETVFNPATSVPSVDLSSGAVTVVITAYVVYSTQVGVANIGSITNFTLAENDVTFTVEASTS